MSALVGSARPAPVTGTVTGSCHCGAVRVSLDFGRPLAELPVRACQCGFCTRHGAMTVSDPAGRVVIELDQASADGYRFATGTSASIVCRICGVYVGAVLEADGSVWSTINLRGLGLAASAGDAAEPVDYAGETPAARVDRRRARWTPTELRRAPRQPFGAIFPRVPA